MFGWLGSEGGFNQICLHFSSLSKVPLQKIKVKFKVLKVLKCLLEKRLTFSSANASVAVCNTKKVNICAV